MKHIVFARYRYGLLAAVILSFPLAATADDQVIDHHDQNPHHHNHSKSTPEMEELFVTASPHIKARLDVLQGSNLLNLDQLEQKMAPTIGETLSGIPGISSTFFGPGASRPIIRGLGGDRIRILTNGIGSIDAASTSPDHAVSINPLTAERVEILRGASTLLYGGNAVGGVVNIIDGRIPGLIPESPVSGRARASYNSVTKNYATGATLNAILGGSGEQAIVAHMDGFYSHSADYDIPDFAKSRLLRAQGGKAGAFGTVPDSDVRNKGGAIGISWIGQDALLGVSYNINKSNYGVPTGEVPPVRIDLDQKRFDLKGNLNRDFLIFEEARLRFGYADYRHTELDGPVIGTIFLNKGWEGRLELIQKEIGILHGSMGLQIRKRNFEALGAEAFVPPTRTIQSGVFAVEEVSLDPLTVEFGARFDHQSTRNNTLGINRNFNNISLSAGAAYHLTNDSMIGLSLARTKSAPTAEQLFSNGPHAGTNAYEIGNTDLTTETATNLELTLKQETERLTASVNLYYTWYNDFIAETFTGAQRGGLNILIFHQQDARFYGGELEGHYLLYSQGDRTIKVNISGDFVRAEFTGNKGNLPRIPAKSATLGLSYKDSYFGADANIRLVDSQTELAANELKTDGYSEINLDLSWRPYGEERDFTVRLQGKNLTNADRRQHTSFLKDLIPMPGRSVKLSLTYGF